MGTRIVLPGPALGASRTAMRAASSRSRSPIGASGDGEGGAAGVLGGPEGLERLGGGLGVVEDLEDGGGQVGAAQPKLVASDLDDQIDAAGRDEGAALLSLVPPLGQERGVFEVEIARGRGVGEREA